MYGAMCMNTDHNRKMHFGLYILIQHQIKLYTKNSKKA